MPSQVQLLTGPARCGKTRRLLDLYRQQLSRNLLDGFQIGRCCWLAPNQTALSQLRDSLLGVGGATGTANVFLQPKLYTFASFTEWVVVGSDRRVRPISSTQKGRLLQHVIQTALAEGMLEYFSRVASTPGFVTQVDEFIAELKRTDVWPDDFEKRCQRRPRSDRRSRELALLYSAYQKLLRQGDLYDGEGRFWAAREILAESTAGRGASLQFDLVVVNGFHDFTTAQYDILRLLSERCSQMFVSLTCETASDATEGALLFAKSDGTYARLLEIFPQLEIEALPALPLSKHSHSVHSLGQLQQQLFREPVVLKAEGGRRKAEVEGVEILAANSELGEVEAIAGRVKALLLRGAKPQAIVVVSRGGESTAALIEAVFPDYGIPYASELRPRLEVEPLVRSLLGLLRLHQEDWPFQTLLEVINHGLFTKFDAADGTANMVPPRVAIEHCLRSAQLPTGKTALLEQLKYRSDVASVEEGGEIDKRGAEVSIALGELRQLDTLFSALPVEAPIGEWAVALETLLAQLGALSSTPRAAVAWKQLRRSLREVERVDAWGPTKKQSLTLTEVQDLIVTVARNERVPAAHDAVGRVRILPAESARKILTQHLLLMGLGEQAFSSATPSIVGSTSTTSSMIESTSTTSSSAGPTETEPSLNKGLPGPQGDAIDPNLQRSDAMLLFYELVTRPTTSLTLSYPALDGKGQPLSPSPLLTDLERSVGGIARSAMPLGQLVEVDATPYSASSFRRQAVAQALAGKQRWLAGMISHPRFVRTGSSILNGIDCIAGRSVREEYGPFEGLLLSGEAQAALARRFDAPFLWSPSRLEGYAACPFRYFAEQILRVEPLGELTLENDPRRRGSLLHQVLATIHEQLSRELLGGEPFCEGASEADSDDLVHRFLSTLDAVVKASPLRGIAQSLREIERREIEAWAPNYAEQEVNYRSQWKHFDEPPRPAHFEVRFGPETRYNKDQVTDRASTTVPFELDLGDERICLTGAIDRIDIGHVGGMAFFNIIDYKSGKAVKLSLDKVRSGHQLQLPLYALAAEQLLLAQSGAVALATGYWNIQGKGFESKRGGSLQLRELADQTLKISDDWKNLQPAIMARVQELVTGIRDGQFPVYNQDEHCTRSCSLSTVCRIGQIRSLEKVWPVEETSQVMDPD